MSAVDVTCVCCIHGRTWLVGDAIESFRRQELGGLTAEMLIVNDCPEQELSCNVPGVRVVNTDRYRMYEDKINQAVEWARGEWIACWDDDDVSLPGRLRMSVDAIGRADYYWQRYVWSMYEAADVIDQIGRAWMCASLIRRDAYLAVGGATIGEWNDQSMFEKMKQRVMVSEPDPDPARIQYVYRWHGGNHLSGYHGIADAAGRCEMFRRDVLSDGRFRAGKIQLFPWWSMDYESAVADAIRRGVKCKG